MKPLKAGSESAALGPLSATEPSNDMIVIPWHHAYGKYTWGMIPVHTDKLFKLVCPSNYDPENYDPENYQPGSCIQ